MSRSDGIDLHIAKLSTLAPAGFCLALHIRSAVPSLTHQAFPAGWVERYEEEAYALRDPIIAWGFSTTGSCRWSEIEIPDPFDILGQAREFDMNFGVSVSCGPLRSRSIASACRTEREFTDLEIERFAARITHLHELTEPPRALTRAQAEALRCIAEGDRHAAAAARLGISESALKARLASARSALLARTTAEAIQRARDQRML
ncbi:autoinducer binding domain-containing protein [Limimaricola litoreus]|uniref:Autoinducer binding domain-containing protein n=1 Tax=Limimaricola litoreus TaxID=2955316 RepID=A0A9X2FPC6_9RHOB|nr:autoinducer binding domain-containing protein [Limimaricola litoreus]MCP1168994.1 autoinducer binding domain-containing protein [Limimaricola litoreus]